jgi:CHAD domain-containing protein
MKRLWKDLLDLRDNLRRRMPKLAEAYFKEGRVALTPGTSWEQMHEFRLSTKRFRYTLETFRDLYGPGIEKRIESLRKVQTFLGDINDCIVTSAILQNIEGMETIREHLAKKADQKTAKLREYWAETFDVPGAEQLWTQYLVNYACRSSPAPRSRRLPAAK